ncbi:hypothetical protein WH95_10130 [Kiloniella litopenaei]|uniref:Glycosyl transferase family 1 domain-containing protein n=1 Tax=Kiloniella litopenaei TaxID=1549748 RepID=A0A0M2RBM0_9PROT|nr:glycosyltransferase [Kiloniella litopenaei]KKJ77013.1 hypothetical protein WH95_10130 [Kiloniella litopenaei]
MKRNLLVVFDLLTATLMLLFTAIGIFLLSIFRHKASPQTPKDPRLLYIGYTGLAEARAKGLLLTPNAADMTYNPAQILPKVTVVIPLGKENVVEQLSQTVHFVELVPPNFPAWLSLTRKAIRLIFAFIKCHSLALEHDVIMLGGPHNQAVVGLLLKLTTRHRIVSFIEAFWEDILQHQEGYSTLLQKTLKIWYRIVYRVFDAYVGAPSFRKDFYLSLGMKEDKIWPYLHQLDISALNTAKQYIDLPAELRHFSKPWILFVGRFEEEKHPVDCIQLAQRLDDQGLDFTLIMAGGGTLKPHLVGLVAEQGLQDKIKIFDALPNSVVFRIACNADYCFAPYSGTALAEALYAGCCIVAYDNLPHRAIAGDGPIIFIPDRDLEAAATVFKDLLEEETSAANFQQKSADYAKEKWNIEAIGLAYRNPLIGKTGTLL